MKTKRIVILGLFVAVAGVLHVVEAWIPLPLPVPGAKLGLANIVSLFVIVAYGWREALAVAVLRVFLGTLLGGVFLGPAFAMSMSGAIFSLFIMEYSYRNWRRFSLVGISVIGSVCHNLAQITVAAFLVSNSGIFWYLPYLVMFALPTGIATGFTASYFLTKLPKLG